MSRISSLIEDQGFQQRLRAARGEAPSKLFYRGGPGGDYATPEEAECDPGRCMLEQCLDQIEVEAGLKISGANIFCNEGRTTLSVQFSVPDAASYIALFHDTLTGSEEWVIIHPEQVSVRISSRSDLLAVFAEPDLLLDEHFDHDAARAFRRTLTGLGLAVAPPADENMSYETAALQLKSI